MIASCIFDSCCCTCAGLKVCSNVAQLASIALPLSDNEEEEEEEEEEEYVDDEKDIDKVVD